MNCDTGKDDDIYEDGEWFSYDGKTWATVDDDGNYVERNPDGNNIVDGNINDEDD